MTNRDGSGGFLRALEALALEARSDVHIARGRVHTGESPLERHHDGEAARAHALVRTKLEEAMMWRAAAENHEAVAREARERKDDA